MPTNNNFRVKNGLEVTSKSTFADDVILNHGPSALVIGNGTNSVDITNTSTGQTSLSWTQNGLGWQDTYGNYVVADTNKIAIETYDGTEGNFNWYFNKNGTTQMPFGTFAKDAASGADQVLTSDGSGNITWQTPASGSNSGYKAFLAGATTLTAADAGSIIQIYGSNVSLPAGADLNDGDSFTFTNESGGTYFINVYPDSGDFVYHGDIINTSTLEIRDGETVVLVNRGASNEWNISGGTLPLRYLQSQQFTNIVAVNSATTQVLNFNQTAANDLINLPTIPGSVVSLAEDSRLAYYSNTASNWLYIGTDIPVPQAGPPLPVMSGLRAWYDAGSMDLGTNTWTDKSGNGYHGTVSNGDGNISVTTVSTGSGATNSFPVVSAQLYNSNSDKITLPEAILTSTYTWISVARWSDNTGLGRLFTQNPSASNNWIAGGFGGHAPVSFHGGWVPSYPPSTDYGTDWVIQVDQPYFMQGNGNSSTIATNGDGSLPGGDLEVGQSNQAGTVYATNMYVAEIIVYDRELDSGEIATMFTYLGNKYGITIG